MSSTRIVIAGASSLLGIELKSLLEESRFAAADFRLVDEELAAGTLTEAAGEAALIRPVEEDSFDRADLVFFAGSPEFVKVNFAAALRAGTTIIDFTGEVWSKDLAQNPWFPKLDELLGLTRFTDNRPHAWVLSAPAVIACSLSLGLKALGVKNLALTFFRPVSEAGKVGIEELESQTSQLLSFQSAGHPIFDAQVAFNLLDQYGPASQHKLEVVRKRLRSEVSECLLNTSVVPSVQILHVPVFYGFTFSAWAELDSSVDSKSIVAACRKAGFSVNSDPMVRPSNLAVAGDNSIQLAVPEHDPSKLGAWWFFGAADNIRLPAYNAVKLAEKLLP
jgi:aspartate-semialdehyde dehydrogenase